MISQVFKIDIVPYESFVDNHHVMEVFFVSQIFKDFLNTMKTHQTLTILILNLPCMLIIMFTLLMH